MDHITARYKIMLLEVEAEIRKREEYLIAARAVAGYLLEKIAECMEGYFVNGDGV